MSNGDSKWYDNMTDMRGYQNINKTGTQAWPEYNSNLFKGMGHGRFDMQNMMRPDNLSQDLGASRYQTPQLNTLDPNWQNELAGYGSTMDRGNIDNTWRNTIKDKIGNFTGIAGALLQKLPRQDPRQVALTKMYGGKNNLQGGQTIQSGLMAGYNPVSGGLLNTLTGGKFGKPTNYGLQRSYDKRIGNIGETLGSLDEKWSQLKKNKPEEFERKKAILFQRQKQLEADKAAELAMLNKVPTTGEGGPVITDGGTTADGGSGSTGGGYTLSQLQDPSPNKQGQSYGAARARTSSRVGPGGAYKAYGLAEGGRIGYQGGEFVDEDINIQGPGFDVNENIEMAETSPFEMRIQELVDEGLSWQEAYEIAAQEFGMAEGQQDSFGEEGIASLV